MIIENEIEAINIADAMGISKCPKCGIVTKNAEAHCD